MAFLTTEGGEDLHGCLREKMDATETHKKNDNFTCKLDNLDYDERTGKEARSSARLGSLSHQVLRLLLRRSAITHGER